MGTSQKYSLRWNDFSINVATTFRDLHSRQVSCHPHNCMARVVCRYALRQCDAYLCTVLQVCTGVRI